MNLVEISQVLGNFGEFLGALAIFATLLYLAIQVRDAGRTARFAAVLANRSERITFFSGVRDSPYIAVIMSKLASDVPLTDEEEQRLFSHYASQWALLYSEWVQRDLGIAGEYMPLDAFPMENALSQPRFIVFWRQAPAHIYPARFVEYVERMVTKFEDQ